MRPVGALGDRLVELGLGLDSRLGLGAPQLRDFAPEAAALGYQSLWTNAGTDYDPVAMCVAWHERSGLRTGISVVPIARNPAPVLALAARTAHDLTGGTFVLGIGSGSVSDRPIAAVRAYLAEIRRDARDVPIYIGALGPQMLSLAGKHAEGAALNWCTAEQIRWSREQAGPRVKLIEYIRVCVDEDVRAARRALAKQILAYALLVRPRGRGPGSASGASVGARGYQKARASGPSSTGRAEPGSYEAHFERMGFGPELQELRRRREGGESDDQLADAIPERLLTSFGYAGTGAGAREWFARMSSGLDVAIVRVLSVQAGESGGVVAAMRAFAPQ